MGSNPAEANGYFQNLQILSTNPPGEAISCGVGPKPEIFKLITKKLKSKEKGL